MAIVEAVLRRHAARPAPGRTLGPGLMVLLFGLVACRLQEEMLETVRQIYK